MPLLIAFAAGLAVLLWQGLKDSRTGYALALLLMAMLLPAGIVYLVSLPRSTFFYAPQLAPRYLLVFAPAFYVLVAWGAASLGKRTHYALAAALLALFGAVAIYGLSSYYPGRILRDDYKSLAATLHAYEQDGDGVLLYTDKDWPVFAYHYSAAWQKVPHAQPITSEWAEGYLSPMWERHGCIWLVVMPYAGINDPQGWVPRWLEDHALAVDEHRYADKVLRLYARTHRRASQIGILAGGAGAPPAVHGTLTSGVQLVGYEQSVDRFRPGDTVHLFLHWQWLGEAHSSPDYQLALVDQSGLVLKEGAQVVPKRSRGPGVVRQQLDVVLPPDAPGGRYRFLVRSPGGDPISELGTLSVAAREVTVLGAGDVSIPYRYEAELGDGVRLLGYSTTSTAVAPGDTFGLTLYWQAQSAVEQRYKVFTHVLGETFNVRTGSFLWGQQDNEPVSDTRPTSTWRAGEVIVDGYAIPIDGGSPSGEYSAEIGMYEPATGTRLPVLDREGNPVADHIVLFSLRVMAE